MQKDAGKAAEEEKRPSVKREAQAVAPPASSGVAPSPTATTKQPAASATTNPPIKEPNAPSEKPKGMV